MIVPGIATLNEIASVAHINNQRTKELMVEMNSDE